MCGNKSKNLSPKTLTLRTKIKSFLSHFASVLKEALYVKIGGGGGGGSLL
jgi:hypothetical protein